MIRSPDLLRFRSPVAAMVVVSLATLTLFALPRFDNNVAFWTNLISTNPESANSHRGLAMALFATNDDAGAERHFKASLELDTVSPSGPIGLGWIAQRRGEFDLAADAYALALKRQPESIEARMCLADMLARQGQIGAAIAHYETLFLRIPGDPCINNNLGILLLSQGKLAEGEQCIRRALISDPTRVASLINLANILCKRNNRAEAAKCLAMAISASPEDFDAITATAIFLAANGNLDGAIVLFRRAVFIRTGSATAYANLGTALASRGAFQEAAFMFRCALDRSPQLLSAKNGMRELNRLGVSG